MFSRKIGCKKLKMTITHTVPITIRYPEKNKVLLGTYRQYVRYLYVQILHHTAAARLPTPLHTHTTPSHSRNNSELNRHPFTNFCFFFQRDTVQRIALRDYNLKLSTLLISLIITDHLRQLLIPAKFLLTMSGVNKNETAQYDTSNLTDDQLAKKAEDALAMEGEMEEVSSIFKFNAWAYLE